MRRLAIIGAGDLGQTIQKQVQEYPDYEVVGFFDDTKVVGEEINGVAVTGGLEDVTSSAGRELFDEVIIGIGYHHLAFREQLFETLVENQIPFARLVHPRANVAPDVHVDQGAVVFAGCVLDSGVRIGANSLLNVGCVVAHDSEIGPHSFLGPSVSVAGFVRTGARCFLGIGTILIDNIKVGDDCQTAGGAVVIKDIEAGNMVAGVPAAVKRKTKR